MNYQRINEIKNLIEKEGRISLDELVERFPLVSSMTLRRDLLFLENRGEVIRVRGGAISVKELSKVTEEGLYFRNSVNVDKKKCISEKTLRYIEPGHSVFIDSGSTTLYFVKELPDIYYNIVTNGINIALELSRKTMPNVTLLGGTVSRNNIATSGSFSTDMLSHINIETAFLAATAFSEDRGFTCGSQSESEIKSYVLKNAKRRIMLLDSTKLGKIMPYTFAAFGDIDVLISDSEFPQELRDKARTLGIVVE